MPDLTGYTSPHLPNALAQDFIKRIEAENFEVATTPQVTYGKRETLWVTWRGKYVALMRHTLWGRKRDPFVCIYRFDTAKVPANFDKDAFARSRGVDAAQIDVKVERDGSYLRVRDAATAVRLLRAHAEEEDRRNFSPGARKDPNSESMPGKYCRICWNTANWVRPTGEAPMLETRSYVATEGFGHEEWLFDLAWPLRGYKASTEAFHYGFLQPIGKYRQAFIGQTFDVCLYAVDPDKTRLAVGVIRDVYVPDDEELAWALAGFHRNGRIEKMQADLRRIGVPSYEFGALAPRGGVVSGAASVANIRFEASNVEVFDSKREFPASHVVNRINRYQPLDWDGALPLQKSESPAMSPPNASEATHPERSEELRKRSAVTGTVYSPDHVKLQNAMYKWLLKTHSADQVFYEKNFVDLTLRTTKGDIFYEIKTAVTVRACVREALGQLLEYGHYADQNRATRLVIVGTPFPTSEDAAYLSHLRRLYSLPITYQRWSWERGELEPEV